MRFLIRQNLYLILEKFNYIDIKFNIDMKINYKFIKLNYRNLIFILVVYQDCFR